VPYEVKFGSDESEWKQVPPDAYPTSAYPLVLGKNLIKYTAFIEETGELRSRRIISTDGFRIEYEDEKEIRRFKIESGMIVSISWGGSAVSVLQESRAAAILGAKFE
jgi:hypothetical protein